VRYLILLSLVCRVLLAQDSTYLKKSRDVPADFKGAHQFLEAIKYPQQPDEVFDAKRAPHWDVNKVMSFISARGIDYTDINHPGKTHFRFSDVRQQITQRKGAAFDIVSHLAHIYSIPYKQYSELSFRRDNDKYIIAMSSWYTLTFVNTGGRFHLIALDYTTVEGD